jgi:tRNA G46 methylase TrmB
MQHALFKMALDDRLFLAPIDKENTEHILDVGCGTGLWCIDVADEMPNTQVLGFDLRSVSVQCNIYFDLWPLTEVISPIQPDL